MSRLDPDARARIHAGLDPQQSGVVDHHEGPALVVAGAGAGKTTTLVRRSAALIARGVDPSGILLLTFTKTAAASIVNKARRFEPAAERIVGGTFHSVAHRLIKENHAVFGLPPNFSMCDPGDVRDVLRRFMADAPMRNGPQAKTVADILSFATNTRRGVSDVLFDRYPKYADHADAIDALATRYADHKKRHHILDYDDLLVFLAAMAMDRAAGRVLRRRFPFVMIDEVQDCNALQVDICLGLGAEGGNVLVVGDPSQAIYGFRGSTPSIMFGFRQSWPGLSTYLIETNYRSTPEIVALAETVDASMRERFDRNLVASRPSLGVTPVIVPVADKPREASYIGQAIVDRRDEGMRYSDMAVLVRSMRTVRHVEVELAARGIPTVVKGGIRLHEAAHIKDVICALRLVANPRDEISWVRLLTLYPKVGDKGAAKIAREIIDRAGDDLGRCIEDLAGQAMRKPVLAGAVRVLEAARGTDLPAAALQSVAAAMEGILKARYEDEWDWRRKDVEALADIAASHRTLDDFLSALSIDASFDKGRSGEGAAPDEEGVVTLATIHSAKGLEWQTIFVPSFVQGHIPLAYGDGPDEDDEERRLLYVLVTRAKTELVVVRPRLALVKDFPVAVPSSPYEHLLADHCERVAAPSHAAQEPAFGGFAGLSIQVR